jgi:hypothetical protein
MANRDYSPDKKLFLRTSTCPQKQLFIGDVDQENQFLVARQSRATKNIAEP